MPLVRYNSYGTAHSIEALAARASVDIFGGELEDSTMGYGKLEKGKVDIHHAWCEAAIIKPHDIDLVSFH